jgi:hypothetical protein
MGSSLYSLGADPTENNVFNNPSIAVMGGCLAIVTAVDVFTGRYQATHVPSRDRCISAVLHVTMFIPDSQFVEWYHIVMRCALFEQSLQIQQVIKKFLK